ncbi:TPA: molecular chaperone DnaJ [Escherichia coli]
MTTGWQELTEQEYEFVKDNASENAEFRTVYTAPPAPVIQADVAQAIENLKQKSVECNRYNYCADAVKGVEDACLAAMRHGPEPVSQTYNLPELIEGMEVSIDVSTCDADLGNRYFGTVTEALELDTAKNGYILLVQDAEPNFDINGNSPVTPDGWVIVPKKLTAENGAKGVLSGEFSETTFISCPECFGDDDCEACDGSGRIEIKVPVSWTTIKTIWAKGCEYFSIVAPQQDG